MLISLAQAAERLGRSPNTLREQIRRGRLHAAKIGRDWLVEESEAERYRAASVERGAGRPQRLRMWHDAEQGPTAVTYRVVGSGRASGDVDDVVRDAVGRAWTDEELRSDVQLDVRLAGTYDVTLKRTGDEVDLLLSRRCSL